MKKDMTDPIITRRDFLIACSIGGTATFVMYHIIKPSRLLFGEESNTAEHIQWNPSEYIENWEKTLLTLFQLQYKGDRAELIFVDQHGKLITVISTTDKIKNKKGHAIPAWSPNKKQFDQEWLNAWRYKIHTQYPSLEFDLTFNQELPKQMNSRRTVETSMSFTLKFSAPRIATGSIPPFITFAFFGGSILKRLTFIGLGHDLGLISRLTLWMREFTITLSTSVRPPQ